MELRRARIGQERLAPSSTVGQEVMSIKRGFGDCQEQPNSDALNTGPSGGGEVLILQRRQGRQDFGEHSGVHS